MTSMSLQARIRDWLQRFTATPERIRDDLHVDQIDTRFKNRDMWADAAVTCLQLGVDTARAERLRVIVAVEFFLETSPEPVGYQGGRVHDLRFSWTPPALTVFRADAAPWTKSDAFAHVEAETGLPRDVANQVFYQEWFDESDGDYDRRLWIVGA